MPYEKVYLFINLFRHGYEPVHTPYEPTREHPVSRALLVRDDIVGDTDYFRMTVPTCQAAYCPQRRSHERKPIAHNHQIRLHTPQLAPDFYPIQGIHGIYFPDNLYPHRGGVIRILRLSREKETGILHCKIKNRHLVTFLLQFHCQPLIQSSNTSSIRVSRT